jgi:hypothetical protein
MGWPKRTQKQIDEEKLADLKSQVAALEQKLNVCPPFASNDP